MSKKKKNKEVTISDIYNTEDQIDIEFEKPQKQKIHQPPTLKEGEYYCNLPACKVENAALLHLGAGVFKCGHCYNTYFLNVKTPHQS